MPTAADRPHRRGDGIYLGEHCVGAIRDGMFSRGFNSTENSLLWGTHLSYRVDLLRFLKREGVHTLHAKDTATRETYTVALADFLRQARPFKNVKHGDQLAVDLGCWHRNPPTGGAVQLGLFRQGAA